ncbi:TetR/AcrR family transcriptional regulator [Caldalkalibacillus mannanilyticus]|uniref:TetR/AcrR family transcriptional regulator n=1 Tax=Caldalkalibacillus mannanilyticus TaxID=1418 RepID=UPI00046A2F25|nr:TetR/AcrR family transcriptional regulator [Caldalkalibacillus mannanilyticus]
MKNNTHSDSKKGEILKAAIRLFSQKGIDGTSVKEIGIEAGVTDAALYKHFSTKNELAVEVFSYYSGFYTQLIDFHASQKSLSFAKKLESFIQDIIERMCEDHFGILLLNQRHKVFMQIAQQNRLPFTALSEFIAQGVEEGVLPQQDVRLTAVLFMGALLRIAVFIDNQVMTERDLNMAEIQQRFKGLIGLS